MIAERRVTLAASDGAVLDARLAGPVGATAGMVIAHPHPLYGGDMDNPVVVRVAEVCTQLGLAALRFNFRGVGASGGQHDGGRAEQHDVDAALATLRGALDAPRTAILAGYSFGALVVARVAAREPGLAGVLLIAPPIATVGAATFDALRDSATPTLVVSGARDAYCPQPALESLIRQWAAATMAIIDGADHFFFGKLYPLGETVRRWLRDLL
jgi:alpha/beta superfamily hydrolase